MIFDEVQTGMGRLGKLFGYEVFGVEPDVITLAKGIASGMAIGAFMAKEKLRFLLPATTALPSAEILWPVPADMLSPNILLIIDIPGNADKMGQYLLEKLEGSEEKIQQLFPTFVVADY